ncbi:MAG: hypothetical protein ACFBSG_06255 [Leptolyngbyaceae cyanobacterium]
MLKKFAAGLLLLWGLPLSIWAVADSFNPETSQEDKEGAIAALIFFGLPPIAISGLLIHHLNQQHQASQSRSQRELEQLFLAELQANNGTINPIIFATKADISLDDCKAYLDTKARQLNGLYEATDTGGILYRFPL